MAITATIALDQTPIGYNQKARALVTVNNSAGAPVNLVRLQLKVLPTGSDNSQINMISPHSALPRGFGQVLVAPATGSIVVPVDYLLQAPQVVASGNLSQSIGATYSVGADVYTSDGAVTTATPATVTITPITAN
jgi:hypothetical protein